MALGKSLLESSSSEESVLGHKFDFLIFLPDPRQASYSVYLGHRSLLSHAQPPRLQAFSPRHSGGLLVWDDLIPLTSPVTSECCPGIWPLGVPACHRVLGVILAVLGQLFSYILGPRGKRWSLWPPYSLFLPLGCLCPSSCQNPCCFEDQALQLCLLWFLLTVMLGFLVLAFWLVPPAYRWGPIIFSFTSAHALSQGLQYPHR